MSFENAFIVGEKVTILALTPLLAYAVRRTRLPVFVATSWVTLSHASCVKGIIGTRQS